MSSITDWIKENSTPQSLSDEEFEAVYDFMNSHKDEWDEKLKRGLLKLLNAEIHRRM